VLERAAAVVRPRPAEFVGLSPRLAAATREPDPAAPARQADPAAPARQADPADEPLRDLVVMIARGLVDRPDEVAVEVIEPGADAVLELHVHPDDLGHVIGKQGRTARSMRLALGAAAGRVGRNANLEIAD
jgi:hypothetical protein